MSNKAKKMSFSFCDETCPALDDAVYKAYDEICKALNLDENNRGVVFKILIETHLDEFKNVGTHLLRDALNNACEKIIDQEDKIEELEYEIKNS